MADLQRLAEAVRARRLSMGGLTQGQAATAAGVSDTTWNQIETGKAVSVRSLAKVGQSLWGDPAAPLAILEGGDPPSTDHQAVTGQDDLLQAVRDLTEVVRELREEMRRGQR